METSSNHVKNILDQLDQLGDVTCDMPPPPNPFVVDLLDCSTVTVTRSSESGLWCYTATITARDLCEVLSCGINDLMVEPYENASDAEKAKGFPVATATAWAGRCWFDPFDDSLEELDGLSNAAGSESVELTAVASRARAAHRDGTLGSIAGQHGMFTTRAVILDSVMVDPSLRGEGLGIRLAARCLHVAAASDMSALVLALAGSFPGAEHAVIRVRVCNLLRGLGLAPLPNGLWAGWGGMHAPGEVIRSLANE